MMKTTIEKPGGTTREAVNVQAFWGQSFSEAINGTPIPLNFREVVVEPFDGTQDPHAHLQGFQTQMYINGGNDSLSCKLFPNTLLEVASSFVSQFVANKVKQLEAKGESLKSYLARFNNATICVNDPYQKFFVKAFQKGLRAEQFSGALALRRPSSMEEIKVHAKKHIEAEEDQAEQLEAERQPPGHRELRPRTQGG
ncbi:hypothetical protein CR513_53441, partial [Mucuna pruriens]